MDDSLGLTNCSRPIHISKRKFEMEKPSRSSFNLRERTMNLQKKGLVIAIATDDDKYYINRHFGDAERYLIYRLTDTNCEYLKKIENTTEEESDKIHADPVKAGSIAKILKAEGVQVLVSKAFGPNIKRVIKKFACVLVREKQIKLSWENLIKNYATIKQKWEEGEGRKHMRI